MPDSRIAPYLDIGIHKNDIEYFIQSNISAATVDTYRGKGVKNRIDIALLAKAGISAALAADYRQDYPLDAEDITDYVKAGITPSQLEKYSEHGLFIADQVLPLIKEHIPPEYAAMLQNAQIYAYPVQAVKALLDNGFPFETAPLYSHSVKNAEELNHLYISGLTPAQLYSALLAGFTAQEAVGLAQHGIAPEDFSRRITQENTCTLYPPASIRFVQLEALTEYQPVQETLPVPIKLFAQLHTTFSEDDYFPLSPEDKASITRQIQKYLKGMKDPSTYDLIHLASDIVSDRMKYADVDTQPELKALFPAHCSLNRFWQYGLGDCDKFAALTSVVFSLLKQHFPETLRNVYMTNALFKERKDHEWNSLVIVDYDHLIMTYLDTTDYQSHLDKVHRFKQASPLNALDGEHFNQQQFLQRYQQKLCQ